MDNLKVTKISRVEKIFAVVSCSPSSVKYMIKKHVKPDKIDILFPNALSKLLPKLSFKKFFNSVFRSS